jgi:selenocysteine lyase/cysteine desulfurase
VQEDEVDLLAFPGHKGLLGPLGTGALYVRPGLEKLLVTSREGGTGSVSDQPTQPDFLPDRFEPGSHNAIGIIALSEGVRWIAERGVDHLWDHERALTERMLDGLSTIPGLQCYGPRTPERRLGVFSVRLDGWDDPVRLAEMLERDFGILTRAGIHCAPLAHQTIGTSRLGGTTRLSFGPFLQPEDVDRSVEALDRIARRST